MGAYPAPTIRDMRDVQLNFDALRELDRVILIAPDKSRWILTVDNTGTLTTTPA